MKKLVCMILAGSALALGLSPWSDALGQTSPTPIVHLMIDTSGSMQYDVVPSPLEVDDFQPELVPTCSSTPGLSGKSRFIELVETLVGSLGDDYYCETQDRSTRRSPYCPANDCYDPVPHIQAYGTRNADGLIDRAGSSVKFSIMTMDTDPDHNSGNSGDYSYGKEKFGSGADKFNYGAQNAHAKNGRLVVPTTSESPAEILANNAAVKASLLAARPGGGTPIGAMMYDAAYMYNNEPVFQNDMYGSCRNNHVVLLTDGRSNIGDNQGGYPNGPDGAQAMRELGFDVWVVQYDTADSVGSQAYDIATYYGMLPDDHLLMANDPTSLADAMNTVATAAAVSASQTRTATVVTEATGNTTDVQYQFNASYMTVDGPSAGLPSILAGTLERSVYQCGVESDIPGVAGLAEIQDIGDKLNATQDTSRNIYTMVRGDKEEFVASNSAITNFLLDAPNPLIEPVPDFGLDDDTDWCGNGTISGLPLQKLAQWRENLFDYIRASEDSCRQDYKLGAIMHSTPALQDDSSDVNLAIPSFAEFKAAIADRPHMLYFTTHEGMLHAIRFDRTDGTTTPDYWGQELWAYIPGYLLDQLRTVPEEGAVLLDGAPTVSDMLMSRTNASRVDEGAEDWKTVLVFGDRSGGRGYTGLDVTDPVDGNWSILWEISATNGRCVEGNNNCMPGGGLGGYRNDFSRLGQTYGRPVIGNVMICPSASGTCAQTQLEEVAVAVIPGGSSAGLANPAAGKTAFVVRLDTGEKLAEFASGNLDGDLSNVKSDCNGTTGLMTADLIGDVSCISTLPGTFLTKCYVGDRAGRLWKMEIGSPSRSDWTMTMFYDPYDFTDGTTDPVDPIRAPVMEAPAISFTRGDTNPVIVFGSGEIDSLTETTQKAFIASITDATVASVPDDCAPWDDNTCFRSVGGGMVNGPRVNWKVFFGYDSTLSPISGEPVGMRLMGAPTIYGGVAYFTTFIPNNGDPCSVGNGRVYGVDYVLNDGTCDTLEARLPDESDPYTFDTYQEIGCAETPAVPYGVTVVNRPTCIGDESIYDAGAGSGDGGFFGGAAGSGTQIVVQTGLDTGVGGEEPAGGSTDRTVNQMLRGVMSAIESIVVGTWGSVFD